jgi:4-amino-4-deoxy-L-arabinose transferase-like glycosyltransferase
MKPFRLLTLAVFAAATVPRLAHRGMFVDGVTYASIARNLAEGRGTFWSPSYTPTLYPQFHEHPPLAFWLQSLWFRVLGDHLFVERLYSVAIALATAGLIIVIWRTLRADGAATAGSNDGSVEAGPPMRDLGWLPVLLWIAVPVVSWAIVGNLLETTVACFTTGAVAAALSAALPGRGTKPSGGSAAAGWSVVSGLCVAAAVLSKGPVGLFPLVTPIALGLLPDRRHRAWRILVVQWATVAVCALLLWTWSTARASLAQYVSQQVVPALAGEREVSSSIAIIKALLQGVLLPMASVGLLAIAAARRFVVPSPAALGHALLLFLVGLSGTLPILISAKQAGHYLVPAVPLFALTAALLVGPTAWMAARGFGTQRRRTALAVVTAVIFLGTAGAALSPAIGRDRERLADLDAMEPMIPRNRIIGLCPESNDDWGLHAWFERRFHVGLDATEGTRRDWFLQTAGATSRCAPVECAAATDARRQLVLRKCRRSG